MDSAWLCLTVFFPLSSNQTNNNDKINPTQTVDEQLAFRVSVFQPMQGRTLCHQVIRRYYNLDLERRGAHFKRLYECKLSAGLLLVANPIEHDVAQLNDLIASKKQSSAC
jgi:hypothetical protein